MFFARFVIDSKNFDSLVVPAGIPSTPFHFALDKLQFLFDCIKKNLETICFKVFAVTTRCARGASWNRTSDTRIFSPLLYQLSYGTKPVGKCINKYFSEANYLLILF